MKKRIWIYLILIIIVVYVIGSIIYNKNHDENEYYDLSKITNVNLDNLYIRGRNNYYNKVLNYLYGNRSKATKLPNGSTAYELLTFYDENGDKKLEMIFYGNQNQVEIDDEEYLYIERNIAHYSTKELYPDKNKNDCEKMLYDIVKLYENDNYYMWDDFNEDGYFYPENYTNGVNFYNEGIHITILEYTDNTIENDYTKECNRIKSWYGGKLKDSSTFENKEINNYIGANKEFEYTIIKYDKFIISIEYRYQYSDEADKNIEILNKYLKDLKIL